MESMGNRIRKKVLVKTNWLKRKKGEKLEKGGKGKKGKPAPKKETRTRSVLLVE